jgi:ABC-type transport system substrate-binding protein
MYQEVMVRRLASSKALVGGAAVLALVATVATPVLARRTAQQAHASSVLVYPVWGVANLWPRSMDPALEEDTGSEQVINLVYSGLLMLNARNQAVPDLAATMPALSNGGKTYTFKIRPDAKFSDGTAVTAQDFVYSWTRALSKQENSPIAMNYMGTIVGAAALNSGKASTLAGAKAIDSHTVQVTFSKPGTYLLGMMTYPTWYPVKQSVPAGANLVGPNSQKLNIGTGPFELSKAWRYRQEMYFAPNPNWYNAKGIKLSEIDVPFIATSDANHREYLAGQVPMTVVPTQYLPSEKHLPDFRTTPELAIDYITLNTAADSVCKPTSCAPVNNIHFRLAMLYAINRTLINHVILKDAQVNLCGIVPNGILGYSSALCSLTPYNPTKAKQELALAKKAYGGTLPNQGQLQLIYQASSQSIVNEYTEVQREWAAVGINVSIKGEPFNNWVTAVSEPSHPILENAWIDDYPDPQDFTYNLLSPPSPYNTSNYNNAQFLNLTQKADVTPNGPDRSSLYVQAQKIAIQDAPFISIGQQTLNWRWKSSIHGMQLSSGFNYPIAVNNDWTLASVS